MYISAYPRADPHSPVSTTKQQLDDGLKSAVVGLTQALVFRRARRVCFGYVRGARMRRLNRLWREKVIWIGIGVL